VAFKDGGGIDFDLTENPYPTWQKLEELVEKGKIRNIGVSKYDLLIFSSMFEFKRSIASIYGGL
jgi:diketogulonate reductase-like aldo/keto reductase